jgi:hypothetical protein
MGWLRKIVGNTGADWVNTAVPYIAAVYGGSIAGSYAGGAAGGATAAGAAGAGGYLAGSQTAAALAPSMSLPDPTLPTQATTQDPDALSRARRKRQQLAASNGRGSTILTGSLGLPDTGAGGGKTLLGM